MIKGVSQAFSNEGLPPMYAFYAKNVVSTILDEVTNERGTLIVQAFLNNSISNILGVVSTGSKIIIFFLRGSSNIIGVFDEATNTYTEKINRTDLGFNPNFPITGEAKLNNRDEIIVTFTDRNTFPKYINLDTASPGDAIEGYALTAASNASLPRVGGYSIESAGTFKAGAYIATVQYQDKNNNVSSWSPLSNPIYIVTDPLTTNAYQGKGTVSGQASSKGIQLVVQNLSTNFTYLRVALISKINDVIEVKLYKTVTITSDYMVFNITGAELTEDVNLEEVITQGLNFTSVDNIESLADQLFVGGFRLPTIYDFQKLTNQISVGWCANPRYNVLTVETGPDPISLDQSGATSILHDEVYALYAQYELAGGRLSDWFHIPGRQLTAGHRANSAYTENIKVDGNPMKVFQLEDTCTLDTRIGDIQDPALGGDTSAYTRGELGVWENDGEFYGADFPDFSGQKVRHHKTPSFRWMKDNAFNMFQVGTGSAPKYLSSCMDVLGFTISLPSVYPPGTPEISAVRIGFAKRDEANMSVLGYDIAMLHASPVINPNMMLSSSGNWEIQATNGSGPNENDLYFSRMNHLRMHCPDIFILRPNITNTYISLINKLRVDNLGGSPYGIASGSGRIMAGQDGDAYDVYSFVSNYIAAVANDVMPISGSYKKLNDAQFVPNNASKTLGTITLNNVLSEEFLHASTASDIPLTIAADASTEFKVNVGGAFTYNPAMFEETIFFAIKVPKNNFFTEYADQKVVPCTPFIRTALSEIHSPNRYPTFGYGDAFVAMYSFLAMGTAPGANNPINLQPEDGLRNFKQFLTESHFNLTQRYITEGDPNTYHLNNPQIFAASDRSTSWMRLLKQTDCPVNKINYIKDFNTVNEYESYGVFNHVVPVVNEYIYGIARSSSSSRNSIGADGWRNFLPNDVFYTVKDKGKIINLQAWGTDALLIHHERALFKTRDKTVLKSSIVDISLGSGDLFAIEPEEITPTDYGYGGTQHKFSCNMSEAGYAFVDANAGEVLLYKLGKNYTNIGKGLRLLFQVVLRASNFQDNPLNATGITMAFDKNTARLTLSLKAQSAQLSFQFDLIKEEWFGGTDLNPDLLFNTRRNIYSFKDETLYVNGQGPRGEYYGVKYPSYIDVVVNDEPTLEKLLHSIEWITRVERNGVTRPDETISHITIWNDYFCTGKITLSQLTTIYDLQNKNVVGADRTWKFNKIRDVVKDTTLPFIADVYGDYRPITSNLATDLAWFEKPEFRGKYFIIRLEYSNEVDKLVAFKGLKPNMSPSYQ